MKMVIRCRFSSTSSQNDEDGLASNNRAVVFVTEYTIKGTERAGQEYASPLLVLTGEEYARITFEELHRKICDALRGNRSPVVAEVFLPDGTRKIFRWRKAK